jgi:hypothetical protein
MKCQFRIFREDGPQGPGYYECNEVDNDCANILRCRNVCRSHRNFLTKDNVLRQKKGMETPKSFDVLNINKRVIKKCTIKVDCAYDEKEPEDCLC